MITSQDRLVNIPPEEEDCNPDTLYREKNVLTSSAACRNSAAILLHEVNYRGGRTLERSQHILSELRPVSGKPL